MIVKFFGFALLFDQQILLSSITISVFYRFRGISNSVPGGKGASFSISFDDEFGCGGFDGEFPACPGNRVTFFQDQLYKLHAFLDQERVTSREMIDFLKGLGIFECNPHKSIIKTKDQFYLYR